MREVLFFAPMKSKREPAWKISNENRLQIFPKGSRQIYLTRPTKILPREAVKTPEITVPPKRFEGVFSEFAIRAAAFVSYKDYYYVSRGSRGNMFTAAYCVSGRSYRANFSGRKFKLEAGDVLLIPARTACDTSASRSKALWFETENTPFWRNVFGCEPRVFKAAHLGEMLTLADMYRRSLYSATPRLSTLFSCASLIAELLRDEFSPDETPPEKRIADFAESLPLRLAENLTLQGACVETRSGKSKLNAHFQSRHGCTFSKYLLRLRMERAAKLRSDGRTLADIAPLVGYSDGHALAYAFRESEIFRGI